MARFRRHKSGEGSTSWRRWSRAVQEEQFDGDLSTVESDVDTFGDSAGRGFEEAWRATEEQIDDLPDAASDDKRTRRLRDIERRRGPAYVASMVLLIAGMGAAGYFGYDWYQDRTSAEEAAAPDVDAPSIVAPGLPRSYADGEAGLDLDAASPLGDFYRAEAAGADPQPVADPIPGLPGDAVAEAFIWGGRIHVGIVGAAVGQSGTCAVVSIFGPELEVLDVAAAGACEGRYDATGDRLACRSESVVVLEVWPTNPSSAVQQPEAATVRVRIERTGSAGEITSARSTLAVTSTAALAAKELSGRPGDEAVFEFDGGSASCTLLDRSGVAVQLL